MQPSWSYDQDDENDGIHEDGDNKLLVVGGGVEVEL